MTRTRTTQFDNRRRPQWWAALLSLFVALSFLMPTTCLCAMAEAAPGHSHSAARESSHQAAAAQHDSRHSDANHHAHNQATLSVESASHICCCDSDVPLVVLSSAVRAAAPDLSSLAIDFAPATLPMTPDVFALTACLGRDGPSADAPPASPFSPATLLGRAPPSLV